MENEDEILNKEKGKVIIDMKNPPKKKSLFKVYELHFYLIAIFIFLSFFFLIPYLNLNHIIQIKKH